MFGFFYPENGERFWDNEFEDADEAAAWFSRQWRWRAWRATEAKGNDLAAFIDPRTGTIVVVRKVEDTAPRGDAGEA